MPQPLRYDGYWYDSEVAWYWVNVRYYDPELMRWLQPDPSGLEGLGTYVYAVDDPLNTSDPSGFCSIGRVSSRLGDSRPCLTDATSWLQVQLRDHWPFNRWPDYITGSGGPAGVLPFLPFPIPATTQVNLAVDRYGDSFWGLAGGLFTPGKSLYLAGGWILQRRLPSRGQLKGFITQWSINGNVIAPAGVAQLLRLKVKVPQAGAIKYLFYLPVGVNIVWGGVPEARHFNDFGGELGVGIPGTSLTASYDWQLPQLSWFPLHAPSWSQ